MSEIPNGGNLPVHLDGILPIDPERDPVLTRMPESLRAVLGQTRHASIANDLATATWQILGGSVDDDWTEDEEW